MRSRQRATPTSSPRPRTRVVAGAALPLNSRRHPLVRRIESGLQRCGIDLASLASQPSPLVVGVSGGADSVALLLGLHIIAQRRSAVQRLQPIAVHVHHHLRSSADRDAEHVQRLCERWQIPFQLEHVHPGTMPGNVLANARRLRYEALVKVAIQSRSRWVAVAHHADDQLETMLAALCRGAGVDGLSAMRWSRPLQDEVHLIRPLLHVRRSECEQFCKAAGIRFLRDPSNRDLDRTRAHLRRKVTPVLEELWPDAALRASATADALHELRQTLETHLATIAGVNSHGRAEWMRSALAAHPSAVRSAVLRLAAVRLCPAAADRIGQRHLRQAAEAISDDDPSPRRFAWPCGLVLSITSKSVRLQATPST